MATIEFPWPPSQNAIWRHAGKISYRTAEYKTWLKDAGAAFEKQRKAGTIGTPIEGPFRVHLAFDKSKRRWNTDLDNRIKVCLDALQKFGVIENDSKTEKIEAAWAPVTGVFIRVHPHNP